MADGSRERILLKTKEGLKGYRIVKLQLMPNNFNVTDEYNIKIWKVLTTGSTTFDFSDNTLLAAGYFENSSNATEAPGTGTIVFDNEIINQDIFITHNSQSGTSCNYYLELEQMPLDLNESTVATLKNMRNTSTPG